MFSGWSLAIIRPGAFPMPGEAIGSPRIRAAAIFWVPIREYNVGLVDNNSFLRLELCQSRSMRFGVTADFHQMLCDEPPTIELRDEFDLLDNDEDRTKLVYAVYGLAAYLCQCLEEGVLGIILAHAKLTGRVIRLSEFEDLEEKMLRKTFGAMLADVRKAIALDGGADDLLISATPRYAKIS